MADLDTLRMLAGKATRGPWQVIVDEHPWVLPAEPERGKPDEKRGNHIERRIATVWDHPQAKAPYPVVGGSVGIGAGKPVHLVSIDEHDAAYIAACDPQTILALLDDNEKLRAALQAVVEARMPGEARRIARAFLSAHP